MIRALVVAAVILSHVTVSEVILRRGSGERIALSPTRFPVDVGPRYAFTTISAAVRQAKPGDTVRVHAGVYAESTVVIDKPLTLVGDGSPVLDGRGQHGLILVTADDVTVQGLVLRNVGASFVEDRAAIRVSNARRCTIAHNRVENGFFGIYLANVTECHIVENTLRATGTRETESGNGIHLWTSRHIEIRGNEVSGHRDGIYFEFVHDSDIRGNVSTGNLRYGLHFMYSDDCQYTANVFRRNGSGVAVMFTKRVGMTGNRFEGNWGPASYGLLLKEISDSRLDGNTFIGNTTGLLADGANRLVADGNEFVQNGWAVKLDASTLDGRFENNDFRANTFDVASNSQSPSTLFMHNYWDAYRGYDLDKNGVGDIPHRPVRLFSVLVEHHQPALILMRSVFADVLDGAERIFPALTPATLVDSTPAMRPLR